jgi:hypothetical protein
MYSDNELESAVQTGALTREAAAAFAAKACSSSMTAVYSRPWAHPQDFLSRGNLPSR